MQNVSAKTQAGSANSAPASKDAYQLRHVLCSVLIISAFLFFCPIRCEDLSKVKRMKR